MVVCARETCGMAIAAAPTRAAPRRKLRRVAFVVRLGLRLMKMSLPA
jgi:hypothetical protein